MLTSIRATRGLNVLDLALDKDADSFYVTDISGLGTNQNILMDDSLYIPGSNYIGRTSTMRNIVLKLAHKSRYVSLSDRRRELGKYFSPGSNVVLEFHSDDHPTLQTVGAVETVETELFVKEPAIVVSIVCQPVPFYGMEETLYSPASFTSSATARTINYEGTTPTGFRFDFTPFNALITIRNADDPTKEFKQTNISDNLASAFPKGRVSTVMGDRYFRAVHSNGVSTYPAPECLDPSSTWIQLYPGANRLLFLSSGATITVTNLRWVPLYEGV